MGVQDKVRMVRARSRHELLIALCGNMPLP